MKKFLLLLSMLIWAPALRSQDTAEGMVAQIVRAGSVIQYLDCDFVQERTSSLMAEPMISSGRMSYKAPSGLIWEYTAPMRLAFIIEGSEVRLERDGATVTPDPNQKKMYREIARLILNCINGHILSDKTVFDTRTDVKDGLWVAEMTPVRKDLAKMWSSIVLCFDPSTKNAVKIELYETSGDSTAIKFSNTKCN